MKDEEVIPGENNRIVTETNEVKESGGELLEFSLYCKNRFNPQIKGYTDRANEMMDDNGILKSLGVKIGFDESYLDTVSGLITARVSNDLDDAQKWFFLNVLVNTTSERLNIPKDEIYISYKLVNKSEENNENESDDN